MAESAMPHVLLLPFPPGHVHPTLKLAELISNTSIHVTFLTIEKVHGRRLQAFAFKQLSKRSTFRFCAISDGLSEDDNPRTFLEGVEESLVMRFKEA